MDFATILGLLGGVTVVIFAIGEDGNFAQFINVQGFIIVLGGTFASTMIKFPIQSFFKAIPIGLKAVVTNTSFSPLDLINQAIELSDTCRKDPRKLLAVEEHLK